jgi:SAM-dependent methyltransferase
VTEPTFDRRFWEVRWSQVLRDHSDQVARRPPNEWLITEVANLQPGFALDAGCGHGSDTLWLAAREWHVTAVDFSATALAHARSTAETVGPDVAERIDWVEGDLSTWTPQPAQYDLVLSLYVHADSVDAMVQRLAAGVAPGGTLFMVGHRPIDPTTGAETAAADQLQVSVDTVTAALDPTRWTFLIAEDRPRPMAGTRSRRRHLCAAPLLRSHLTISG